MAIALVNKQKHKEKFRLVENPKIIVLGLVHEPPEEIRYSANTSRMFESSGKSVDLCGKQIQGTGRSKVVYLCGSFVRYRNDRTYCCYEANELGLKWSRQVKDKHPVTGLETGTSSYSNLGNINVNIIFDTKAPYLTENPTQFGYIYSTDELIAGDIVGDFLIRETRKVNGLYYSRFEYKVVKPNG